ncbi:ABC transporter substrate-binding protein [Paenibacillus yanchengensis]|uniref:ABC transporter substrate-binding protein n=1 Tax=Paenibacillus yanchengensis TaxID=2035833 RepID=A0ABW4YJ75_9BACL
MMRRIFLIIVIILLLAGCTLAPADEKKHVKIIYSTKMKFNEHYGSLTHHFPNVTIEVIEYEPIIGAGTYMGSEYVSYDPQTNDGVMHARDWLVDEFIAFVEQNKPDILYYPAALYFPLYEAGILRDVTDVMSKEEMQTVDHNVKEMLATIGDGNIHAFAETITPNTIYYNKDIFKKMGLEEPQDDMTWEQLLELATVISKLGQEEKVIGLHLPYYSMSELYLQLGKAYGLDWYDDVNKQTLFHHEQWQKLAQLVVEKFKADLITNPEYRGGMFHAEEAAMIVETNRLWEEFRRNPPTFEWDIAAIPMDEASNNRTSFSQIAEVSSVYKHTGQVDVAKQIWVYLNSELAARKKHNVDILRWDIPIRSTILKDVTKNMAAYYTNIPYLSADEGLPRSKKAAVRNYIDKQFSLMITNELPLEEAIKQWDMELLPIIAKEE